MTPPATRLAALILLKRVLALLEQAGYALAGPVAGIALLLLCWQVAALHSPTVPNPAVTLNSLLQLVATPFAKTNGNPTGIGWIVMITLKRLIVGYACAVTVGLFVGFVLGRSALCSAMAQPLINVFRHVSPLAWLPFGLIAFERPEAAAIWTIFICASWPIISTTAEAIRRVPAGYLKVAQTLQLPEYKVLRRIVLPAALPTIVGGLRHGLATAWLVIVAAELFTNSPGIGAWLRSALADLDSSRVLMAILVVGCVGLVLDLPLLLLKRRLSMKA